MKNRLISLIGNNRALLQTTCAAILLYFVLGTSMGWTSVTVAKLKNKEYEPYLTTDEASWVASFLSIGGAIIPIPVGYIVDIFGRKTVLLGISVPFLLSWILQIFADSALVLYFARTIAGMSMGASFAVGSIYLGEIAVDSIRGALGTVFQIMLALGQIFVYSIGPSISPVVLSIIGAVFPVIFFALFVWSPESPYFYILKNRRADAEKSLMKLRSAKTPDLVQEELEAMERFAEETKREKGSLRDLFGDRRNRKALTVTVGLMLVQVFSGYNVILNYSTIIFQDSNTNLSAELSVIIIGVAQLVLSIICASLVDIAGRRPMLLISTIGGLISQACLGLFFYLKDETDTDMSSLDWLPVTAVVVYLIAYIVGLASLPLAMLGELFPASVKGMASSITITVMGVAGFVITKLYQVFGDNFGSYVIFWFFSVCCLLGTAFIALVVPETKGKTLMQINRELGS